MFQPRPLLSNGLRVATRISPSYLLSRASRVPPRSLLASSRGFASSGRFDADHSWRQQNHIWSEDEITDRMLTANDKHVPQTFAESLLQKIVRIAYHTVRFTHLIQHPLGPPT